MKPTFKTVLAWEQAQVVMQPTFIRVIDNLRKELEISPWQGSYEEVQIPYLGYHLHLTQENQSATIDIWQLCFQICFLDYPPSALIHDSKNDSQTSQDVDIDPRLIDENGNVDWQQLETKTQRQIKALFASLPSQT